MLTQSMNCSKSVSYVCIGKKLTVTKWHWLCVNMIQNLIYIWYKLISVLLWTPTHRHANDGRPARTYWQHICVDTGCSLEDLLDVMDEESERKREREREREREIVREIHCLQQFLIDLILFYNIFNFYLII